MDVVAEDVTNVQKVPQECFAQQRMDDKWMNPMAQKKLPVPSLSASTSDHPFIVCLRNGQLSGQFHLPNCNPGLLLISGSGPSWKGLGCSKLCDGF